MFRRLYLIGIAIYAVLFIFSVLFYKERTILNDTAYNLFYIIKDANFIFPSLRFGEAFTQIFPLAGRWASASLQTILVLYSSGFIIFYFACYFVTGTVLKQYAFSLCILLFHTLFATESFYYIPSAVIQGTTFFLVAMAFLARFKSRSGYFMAPLAVLFAIVVAFFHPLMVFVACYSLAFFWLQKEPVLPPRTLMVFGITFILLLILKTLLIRLPYETHSLGGLKHFVTLFPNYFSLYSHRRFSQNCLTEYYWIPVASGLIAVYYLYENEKRKALLFLVSFVGYYFLVSVSYPSADTPAWYMENVYMPLGIMLPLPLCFDVAISKPGLISYLCILILVTGCFRIFSAHYRYTARLDWERRFMHTHSDQKLIYSSALVPMDTLIAAWGTPYEFWLLSTLEQKKTASIIIDPKPRDRTWAAFTPALFVVNWDTYPYKDLPKKYFIFTDSVFSYKIVPESRQ